MANEPGRIDDVTGERVNSDTPVASPSSNDGAFRLGIAGYDLWPHAINFCHSLKDADFTRITAVWDDEPEHLARLVELTGAEFDLLARDFQDRVVIFFKQEPLELARALRVQPFAEQGGRRVLSHRDGRHRGSKLRRRVSRAIRVGVRVQLIHQ